MAYVGQHQILVSELRAALLAIEMIVAVSSLSVPGLLDEYWFVDGDKTVVIFNLKMIINAQEFTVNKGFEPANNSFKQACDLF